MGRASTGGQTSLGRTARGVVLLLVLGAAGCRTGDDELRSGQVRAYAPASAVSVQRARGGGPAGPLDNAARQFAEARCELESRCAGAAGTVRFASTGSCLEAVAARCHAEWSASPACANGIDDAALQRCLDTVRTNGCVGYGAGVNIDECSSAAVCGR
jgi:hypothetical protein